MQNTIKQNILFVIQHKLFSYFISSVLALGIVYYGYTHYIAPSYQKVALIKKNIGNLKENDLKKEIKKLKESKAKADAEYKALNEEIEAKQEQIYDKKYDVVLDIMNKINAFSFNIYKYSLNSAYDELTLELNGSYLNVIRFFDYIQTIKANIDVASYALVLKEEKLVITMKLKIGELKL